MSGITVTTHSARATRSVGRALAPLLGAGDLVLLAGGLGVGKTELAKGIGEGLGVEDTVVSPTFTIAREYDAPVPLVHVDVYRLDRLQEVVDLALEERDDAVTVVEWGDAASSAFPADRLEVVLERTERGAEETRMVTLVVQGEAWRAREADLRAAMHAAASEDLDAP